MEYDHHEDRVDSDTYRRGASSDGDGMYVCTHLHWNDSFLEQLVRKRVLLEREQISFH